MGDHHDRLAELVDGRAHEREDLAAGAAVEVAGRLVGEDQLRLRRQRPGDGDALLLAAGELARAVLEAVAEADGVDDRRAPTRWSGLAPASVIGSVMFSVARERRQQVERLEDEADALAADLGQLAVAERPEVDVAGVFR